MDDGKKFREMLTVVCEKYEKVPSQILSDMIWEALLPHSNKKCIAAFNYVFKYRRFYKDLVPDLMEFLERKVSTQDKATIEADKILSHLKTYGGSQYPEITDPITKHLMSHRWNYKTWATQILESEIVWWKKEFINSYNSFSATEKLIENPEGRILKIVDGVGKSI